MTTKSGKAWGETRALFQRNNVELHRIEVRGGGYCSKHRHAHKWNAFYVEKGRLRVTVWKNDYALVDETVLEAGEYMEVAPREYHQFDALEDTVAYELYWVELQASDIERESVGGVV